jgi:hypothetical protein
VRMTATPKRAPFQPIQWGHAVSRC